MARASRKFSKPRNRTKIVGSGNVPQSLARSMVPMQNRATLTDGSPNVAYVRKEVHDMMELYQLIEDCIGGELRVKKCGDKYLPRPNAEDTGEENRARYDAYLARAVFYNVTRRTLYALVGQIFLRDPQVDVPANLQVLSLDANGEGVPLQQIGQEAAKHTIAFGRAGLFVDFPTVDRVLTRAQLDTNDVRPIIQEFGAHAIVNWRKALRGARVVYTLIVVRENYTEHDDGFEAKTSEQYKVMRLISAEMAMAQIKNVLTEEEWREQYGVAFTNLEQSPNTDVYRLEVWRRDTDGNGNSYMMHETYFPKGHDGKTLNEIPWTFIGAEKNDDAVDHPPLADMAQLNMAHYRNSADYEETSYLTGQPTPYVSGVTQEWNENVLKGSIQLGSRGVIALPNGGTAGLLQADANGVPKEAMDQKERQMVALGAKLVEQRQVQRTATEAQMEGTADTSILANIAKNISSALEWSVKKCCVFTGDAPTAVSVKLNTEFDLTRMDPAERQQLLLEYQGSAIAFEEMRANLRRGGVATLSDTEAQAAIAKDDKKRLDDVTAKAKAIAAAQPPQPSATPPTKAPSGE